ncbi:TonB-dependent receptor [Pontibacter sp. G13]|uniref:TonB-dependent receptor n=1 Tax=Pontibacter sp. G13 TaxID=3074898 RepID=UPI00288AC200|nr:TonB-dependent receptor [Pontibacter sp. G13]WNJ18518.1 TonB-dependent receptor [Pontibacter sp. G13]
MKDRFLFHVQALLIILLMGLPMIGLAQQTTLQGSIYNRGTGKPLKGAKVELLGTTLDGWADQNGYFTLKGIEPGVYTLQFSRPGFKSTTQEIVIGTDSLVSTGVAMLISVRQLEQQPIDLPQRYDRDPMYSPSTAYRIDAYNLIQDQPRQTSEALSQFSGVWNQPQFLADGSLQLRGVTGNRNVYRLNDIRLGAAFLPISGGNPLGMIDPFMIDRAEVLLGTGSVAHGAEAFGGVVSMTARQPVYADDGWEVHGRLQGQLWTGDALYGGNGEISLGNEQVGILAGYGLQDFGNLPLAGDRGRLPNSDYQQQSYRLLAKAKVNQDHEIIAAYIAQDQSNVGLTDQPKNGMAAQEGQLDRTQQISYVGWNGHFDNKWFKQLSVKASWQSHDFELDQAEGLSELNRKEETDIQTLGAKFEVKSQPNLYWNLVSGVEWYYDQANTQAQLFEDGNEDPMPTRGMLPDGSIGRNLSVYTIQTFDVLKLRLTFGGRATATSNNLDNLASSNTEVKPLALTGNISAMYPLHPNYQLFSSFTTGYRAPNLYDLGSFGRNQLGWAIPSDSLAGERSFTSQIGFKAKTSHFSGSFSVYRTQYTDYIDWTPGSWEGEGQYEGVPVYQEQNVGQAYIQGVEAEIEIPVNRTVAFYGGIAYALGKSISLDQPLSEIAPLNSRLGFQYKSRKGVWGKMEWFYTAEQDNLSPNDIANPYIGPNGTAGWNRLDLRVGYDFPWGYAMVGIQNLLDETYRYHGASVEGMGRNILMSLQLGF